MSELVTIGTAGNKRMVLYTGPQTLELEVHLVSPGIHAVINTGQEPVVIEKLYGPASFRPVRVTPVVGSSWQWVVEQLVSDHPHGLEDHWQEVARFDCIHDQDKSEIPEQRRRTMTHRIAWTIFWVLIAGAVAVLTWALAGTLEQVITAVENM
jgi:hypothetical protein